jgi:hypothetical protein
MFFINIKVFFKKKLKINISNILYTNAILKSSDDYVKIELNLAKISLKY